MEKVTGIGGVFFRARDPDALMRWYAEHLGVAPPPATYDEPSWWQDAGPTIFTAMSAESGHFERPEQSWAINFRVDDLDAMVAQLRAADIDVDTDPQTYPNGRFASTRDPEGNPIQLWQPDGVDG
jgi:glyoxylase I family protein